MKRIAFLPVHSNAGCTTLALLVASRLADKQIPTEIVEFHDHGYSELWSQNFSAQMAKLTFPRVAMAKDLQEVLEGTECLLMLGNHDERTWEIMAPVATSVVLMANGHPYDLAAVGRILERQNHPFYRGKSFHVVVNRAHPIMQAQAPDFAHLPHLPDFMANYPGLPEVPTSLLPLVDNIIGF